MSTNTKNISNTKETMSEPTMRDLYNMLKNTASKNDIENVTTEIRSNHAEINEKIQNINKRIDASETSNIQHIQKLQSLEYAIELLKQEQLKNNICISGVPNELVNNNNTTNVIINIAETLKVDINEQNFTSYFIANKKFIVVHMFSQQHKLQLLTNMRAKKSLMVEEIFNTKSNSQIYLNEHLTPYFNNIYLHARKTKKERTIHSVSSHGGKIKIRIHEEDSPIVITSIEHLQETVRTHNKGETSGVTNNVDERTKKKRIDRTLEHEAQRTYYQK